MKSGSREANRAIWTLGLSQIPAWGSLFYSLSVLGPSIARDLRLAEPRVFSGLTLAIVVAGLASPAVGRATDTWGAKRLLVLGNFVAAIVLFALSVTTQAWLFFALWGVSGLAMASTLYEAAFMEVRELRSDPQSRRAAITRITLIGGFASTVMWPLLGAIEARSSWRTAFVVAGSLVAFSAVLLQLVLPAHVVRTAAVADESKGANAAAVRGKLLLAFGLAIVALVVSGIATQVPALARAKAMDESDVLVVAALLGPSQVAGRLLEASFLKAHKASRLLLGALTGIALSPVMLVLPIQPAWLQVAIFVVVFGVNNGLLTIARGAFLLERYGAGNAGRHIGQINSLSWIAMASGPLVFAWIVTRLGA